MHVLLLSLLAACGGDPVPQAPAEPRPEGWFDPGLAESGASEAYQLYRMAGRYELPESSVPADHDPGRRFRIALSHDKKRRYKGALPFDVGNEGRRFAPPGMRVYLDGEPIPYGKGRPSWDIKGDTLIVEAPRDPGAVEVAWEGVQSNVDRHQFSRAGLPAAEFVRYTVTLDDHTRDGMLLPAPARAEWDVTLPPDARFESWVALEPGTVATDRSDGAIAVLSVVEGDRETEVGRYGLTGPSEGFERWQADLSTWSGKQVTLRLSTDPAGKPWFDYVFLGAPTVWGEPSSDVRHVVVIGLDTTRPDHMSFFGYERPTTPEFDVVLGQSAIFDEAYTPAPRTRPSFRSATTGRDPLMAVGAKNIGEVFQENGFATAAYVANIHLQPRFGFHHGFDSWLYDGRADAAEQVSRALKWLEDNRDRDTYLFLHIMDPHIFYNAPGVFRDRFVEDPDPDLPGRFNRWQVYSMDRKGELDSRRKAHIEALYDGEMAYTSVHLARFFDGLDALGGDNLVVIHNDHGEEFWEHGGFEHNHNLYFETTNALLAFRPGHGMASPIRLDTPATLADIAPTLYDFAGFHDVPPTDGKSLRPLLEGGTVDWADRPIGVAHLRYGHEQWAVVHQGKKYLVHTASGAEELYDLAADPEEQKNISEGADLTPWREALATAHDMPVGPGWRIFVDAPAKSSPIRFELPEPPVQAGLIDPESTVENPNNQAWGEPPSRIPEEIGAAALDGATFTWTPGHAPKDGLLYVLWDQQRDPAGLKLTRDGEELTLAAAPDGSLAFNGRGTTIKVVPGTVLVPPPGEAARMRALEGDTDGASEDQLALLEAMGYIGGGEDDEGSVGSEDEAEDADEAHDDDGHGH